MGEPYAMRRELIARRGFSTSAIMFYNLYE